jgi:hypothetical protein
MQRSITRRTRWRNRAPHRSGASPHHSDARFPRSKRLADFDLRTAPAIPPACIAALATLAWLSAGEPVVLLGDPGTGESHLLIGLGIAACEEGRRVRPDALGEGDGASDFARNMLRLRAEMRAAIAITRPVGFVSVDLAGGS